MMIPELVLQLCASIAGMLLGSFIGLSAYRIPRQQQLITGVSRCDYCDAPLRWLQKFPLVGFLLFGGRSSCCNRKIPLRYFMLELIGGVTLLVMYRKTGFAPQHLPALVFLALLAIAALVDLDHQIIPDKITLFGIVLSLLGASISAEFELLDSVLGILACGGFLYVGGWVGESILKKPEAMGGGDIKLAAMIGGFLGWQAGLAGILVAAFLGLGFGFLQILTKGWSFSHRLPFGPFLAMSSVVMVFWGDELLNWYFQYPR